MRRLDEVLRGISGEAAPARLSLPKSAAGGAAAGDGAFPSEEAAGAAREQPLPADVCALCGGAGFVRLDVPLGDSRFGQAVPCRCVEEEGEEARLARLQRYSNLGPLTRLTFDNLTSRGRSSRPADQERFQRCVEDARAFAERPEGWLVLGGASGCGKTHIAAAAANRCLERGTPALFVVVPDLLDHLRAAYSPASEVGYDQLFEQVRNAPVLILDDLGTQSATAWAQEKLFQLINHRFNARLPTIVTTNIPLAQLDERLRTRLTDPALARVYVLKERRVLEENELRLNRVDAPMIREMTFETFVVEDLSLPPRDRRLRETAFQAALAFAEDPQGWLVFIGEQVREKTHLAAAICNYQRSRGEPPFFVLVEDLLKLLRHMIGSDSRVSDREVFQELQDMPLLVLDDLEIGTGSDWSRRELFQLLNSRYQDRLPTVITTPHPLNKLRADSGWERLASLLADDPAFCSVLPLGEPRAEPEAAVDLRSARRGTRVRRPP